MVALKEYTSKAIIEMPKLYKTIVIDPPWTVRRGPGFKNGGKCRKLEYPTLSLQQIERLPISSLVEKNAHIYLWTINKYLEPSFGIIRKWGFTPSTTLVWIKSPRGIGLGGTYCLSCEYIIFARKGTLGAQKKWDTNWWKWQRQPHHSQKPEEFQTIVEQTSPGPYLELFARRKRNGWDSWGDEVDSDIVLEVPFNRREYGR